MADRKADQISSHFYTKLFYVVLEGRDQSQQQQQDQVQGLSESKVDKWFNLTTPTPTRPGRTPPFGIEVVLILPDIKPQQVLVSLPSRTPLPAGTTEVLLERWTLNHSAAEARDDLSTIYKNAIPLFRAIWSLLRVLPSWAARAKWRRINARVQVRVVETEDSAPVWIAERRTHAFTPVPHPRGTISLTAEYLAEPAFSLEDRERLLSSRIRNEEAEEINDFMPTIRASSSSRPTSVISSSPAGRASVLSASPALGSSPARRPHPHPFKSDTLSGSLSSVNVGLTGLVAGSNTTSSSLKEAFPLRPSPSSGASPATGSPLQPRKRYSSSFGPRYAAKSDGSSSPSGSSVSVNERRRWPNEDTEDVQLSQFVQDIDTRKPLRTTAPAPASPPKFTTSPKTSPRMISSPLAGRERRESALSRESLSRRTSLRERDETIGLGLRGQEVLTEQDAISRELDRLNDEFLDSLKGLGSGRERD